MNKYRKFEENIKPFVYGFFLISGLFFASILFMIGEQKKWGEIKMVVLIIVGSSIVSLVVAAYGFTKIREKKKRNFKKK